MPEGSICCNVESTPGDRGSFARCSGDYVVVVSHDEDKGTTKVVKMPPPRPDMLFLMLILPQNYIHSVFPPETTKTA